MGPRSEVKQTWEVGEKEGTLPLRSSPAARGGEDAAAVAVVLLAHEAAMKDSKLYSARSNE